MFIYLTEIIFRLIKMISDLVLGKLEFHDLGQWQFTKYISFLEGNSDTLSWTLSKSTWPYVSSLKYETLTKSNFNAKIANIGH